MSSMISQRLRQRRWPFVLLAILAIAGVLFSCSGIVMAGMFTVSNPEQLEHWRLVAYIYLGTLGLALLLLVVAGGALWRRRRGRSSDQQGASRGDVVRDER
jgi:cytochrome c biogenesis protein CcdA